MQLMLNLGRRVQLQSMDPHCADITIGLYQHADESGRPRYALHSYSKKDGKADRLAFLADAMVRLGGMELVPGLKHHVRWPCGDEHLAATKRVFVEVCKLSRPEELVERPAAIEDSKIGGAVMVMPKGQGRYEIGTDVDRDGTEARLKTICAGYLKLAEMDRWEESETGVRFACGQPHDALMKLLLFRAINARAALREQEMMASRGVLVAPSAQNQAT
jgi:hypothetical protein